MANILDTRQTVISLFDLPLDIVLETSLHLDLADIMSLSSTSRALRETWGSRTLWINALEKARHVHPICCPSYKSIPELNTRELKEIAFRTVRLRRNLSSPSPRITGPIQVHAFDRDDLEIVAIIPGTEIYILYFSSDQQIACFEASTSKMIRASGICYSGIQDVNYCAENGMFTLAFLVNGLHIMRTNEDIPRTIHVFCIQYSPDEEISMHRLFLQPLDEVVALFRVFLWEDVVGVVFESDMEVHVRAFNIKTGTIFSKDMEVDTNDQVYVLPILHEGNLFIMVEGDDFYIVYKFHRDALPYETNAGRIVDDPYETHGPYEVNRDETDGELWECVAMTGTPPSSGVCAVTIRDCCEKKTPLWVRFWPCSPTRDTLSPLSFSDTNPHTEGLALQLPDFCPVYRFVLVMSRYTEGYILSLLDQKEAIYLIHRDEADGTLSTRTLILPSGPESPMLSDVRQILMDYYRGVVVLRDHAGRIFTVPYG